MVDFETGNNSQVTFARANEAPPHGKIYKVEERPPFFFSFFNALQIVLCQIINIIWLPLLLSPALCMLSADPSRVQLVSTAFLTSGVVTSIQATFGLRLATVSGPSALYAASFLSLLQASPLRCPSDGDLYAMGPLLRAQEWGPRLRQLQGALIFAGLSQALLGFSRLEAQLCRLLSPASAAPAVILAGVSGVLKPIIPQVTMDYTLLTITIVLMVVFTFQLQRVCLPVPTFSMQSGLTARCFPVFRMFPVLWSCVAVSVIYKVSSAFSATPDVEIEENSYQEAVDDSKWFFFSFPFEWGLPTLSVATAVHLAPAIILQSITSNIMFYANANACGVSSPPRSAVSRALGVEGLGLVFGALWGHAVTTSPTNIGLLSYTGMVSRSSTQLAAFLMICLSHFTRLTALLADIPITFLAALHICLYIGLISVGFSMLRLIDLSSHRDSFILGFSLFCGLAVPQWIESLLTGVELLDSVLRSSVMVALLSGLLLDILLPGSIHNQKFHPWRYCTAEDKETYRLPTWEELVCSALERLPF